MIASSIHSTDTFGLIAVCPFFVVGNPRSGTSLLRAMLNCHPDIVIPPECGFAHHFSKTFASKTPYTDSICREFAHSVHKSKKFETWGVSERELYSEIINKKPITYADLCSAVYLAYARKLGKHPRLIGDKNNYFIYLLQDIRSAFPVSRLIFVVRDGRDVACSYREVMEIRTTSEYRPNLPSDIDRIANQWKTSCQQMIRYLDSKTIFVRYEDLVKETKSTLEKIHNFLKIKHLYAPHQHLTALDEPPEFMAWKERLQMAPDKSRISRFRKELTKREIMAFEKITHEELLFFGYR